MVSLDIFLNRLDVVEYGLKQVGSIVVRSLKPAKSYPASWFLFLVGECCTIVLRQSFLIFMELNHTGFMRLKDY